MLKLLLAATLRLVLVLAVDALNVNEEYAYAMKGSLMAAVWW
jgi:hypothetical protein